MKRNGPVLVTGAAGFGGSHLVEHLLEHGEHVVALDHPEARPEHLATVRDRIEYLVCDLAGGDAEAVRSVLGGREFKEVYHLAGLASVRRSFGEMRRTLEVNALATLNLLGALLRQGTPPRLLLVGSAEQYGIGPAGGAGFSEDSAQQPVSPYALSKVWQEALGCFYARTERWPILMTRTFNHTGPRQGPDFVCADFARQIARIELRLAEPVLRVGNLDAARDFLDVRDVVAAYCLVLQRGVAGSVFNVCSGKLWRIADLLKILLGHAVIKIKVEVEVARHRPIDIPVLLGDPGRLIRETGWGPHRAMESTLNDLLEYWRERTAAEAR
ncbi:MAG: GDP-mannose 4,6-dehydratase [Candidatus Methylomirabilia bacterium]